MLSDAIKYGSIADVVEATKDIDITKGPIPPFYTAVISKRKDMVGFFASELVRRPFKVVDPVFGSPHTFALTHGMPDVTCFFIDHGYDPNATVDGSPIIHMVDEHYANALIDRGANINAVDARGATILMKSCLLQMGDFFVMLIRNHADVNMVDQQGNTALHFAVYGKFPEAVQILLNSGAIMVPNKDGKTPLELANSLGLSAIAEIITSSSQSSSQGSSSSGPDSSSSEPDSSSSGSGNTCLNEEIIM